MKLVIASNNTGKVTEISTLLKNCNIEIVSLADYPDIPEIIEDGATFMENALKKAGEVCAFTGHTSLADDSGLEVDALNGRPGIFSARFAPTTEARNKKLLKLLKDTPYEQRTARFVCALAVVGPDNFVWTTTGRCEGIITQEPSGEGGFGYDPLFYYNTMGKTFAELPIEIKNQISHRGIALKAFEKAVEDEKLRIV